MHRIERKSGLVGWREETLVVESNDLSLSLYPRGHDELGKGSALDCA